MRRTREADREDRQLEIEAVEKGVNAPVNAEMTRLKGETDARATLMKVEGNKDVARIEAQAKTSPEVLASNERIAAMKADKEKETAIEVARITSEAQQGSQDRGRQDERECQSKEGTDGD